MDAPDTTFDRDRGLLNTPPSPPMRVDRHSEAISGPAMGGSLVNLVDNTTGDVRDGSPASPGRNDLGDSATDRHRLSPPCGARAAVPSQMAPNSGAVFRKEGRDMIPYRDMMHYDDDTLGVPLQMATDRDLRLQVMTTDGHVDRGRRSTVTFDRRTDSVFRDSATVNDTGLMSSNIDGGYLSGNVGSFMSPPIAQKHTRGG